MNFGKIFACCQIGIAVCACIGYAIAGDVRRSVYWGAAAVLTVSVTL